MKKNRVSHEQPRNYSSLPGPEAMDPAHLRQKAEAYYQKNADHFKHLPDIESQRLLQELNMHQIELEMQNDELRQLQVEVEEGLQRYTDLYDFAPVGLFTLGFDGTIQQVNLTGTQLLGVERIHLVGRRLGLFIKKDHHSIFNTFIEKTFVTGEKQVCELLLQQDRQDHQWVRIEGTQASNGRTCRAALIDITAQKKMELSLGESEKRFHTLFQQVAVGVALVDTRTGRYVDINQKYCDFLGYTRQEMLNLSFQDVTYPADLPNNLGIRASFAAEKTREFSIEKRYLHKDGRIVWVNLTVSPFWAQSETPVDDYKVAVVQDITERKRAEEALQEALQFNQEIITCAGEGILAMDRQFKAVMLNPIMEKLIGLKAEEVLGKTGPDLFPHLREFQIDRMFERVLAGETVVSPDLHYYIPQTEKSGWRSATYAPRRNASGMVIGIIATIRDITDRKRAEDEIRSLVARAETLVRTAAILTTQFDMENMLISICKEACQVLNVSASNIYLYDEALNEMTLAASFGFSPDFKQRFQSSPLPLVAAAAGQLGFDRIGVYPLGEKFPNLPNLQYYLEQGLRTIMAVKINHNQKLVGVVNVFSMDDMPCFGDNERTLMLGLVDQLAQGIVNRRLFDELSDANKRLSQVSRALIEVQESERRSLALELHDEFGQILSGIKISLDMVPILPPAKVGEQLQRASALVGDLITRITRMSLELRPSMLDDLGLLPALNWLFKNYQAQCGEAVTFEHSALNMRFAPHVEITAYRIIQQALTNVVRHAGNKKVTVKIWIDSQNLNLQIRDFGVGFNPKAALAKGGSSGLSGMIERARLVGGEIDIQSAPGKGATLSARLPLAGRSGFA